MISGVQRSAKISAARATGQYCLYLHMKGWCAVDAVLPSPKLVPVRSDFSTAPGSGSRLAWQAVEVAMSRCKTVGRIQTLLLLSFLFCAAGRAAAAEPVNEWSARTS